MAAEIPKTRVPTFSLCEYRTPKAAPSRLKNEVIKMKPKEIP